MAWPVVTDRPAELEPPRVRRAGLAEHDPAFPLRGARPDRGPGPSRTHGDPRLGIAHDDPPDLVEALLQLPGELLRGPLQLRPELTETLDADDACWHASPLLCIA